MIAYVTSSPLSLTAGNPATTSVTLRVVPPRKAVYATTSLTQLGTAVTILGQNPPYQATNGTASIAITKYTYIDGDTGQEFSQAWNSPVLWSPFVSSVTAVLSGVQCLATGVLAVHVSDNSMDPIP